METDVLASWVRHTRVFNWSRARTHLTWGHLFQAAGGTVYNPNIVCVWSLQFSAGSMVLCRQLNLLAPYCLCTLCAIAIPASFRFPIFSEAAVSGLIPKHPHIWEWDYDYIECYFCIVRSVHCIVKSFVVLSQYTLLYTSFQIFFAWGLFFV